MNKETICNQKECSCNKDGMCTRESKGNVIGICWMEKGEGEY